MPYDSDEVLLESVQLSFVHVGIRDYTQMTASANPYPIQNPLKKDSFIFISAISNNIIPLFINLRTFIITND